MKASLVLALFGACTQPAFAVIQFPFARRGSPPSDVASSASKPRAVNAETFMGAMTYVVNATIGTPGQPVSLVLSSSTSDTWVKDTRSGDCTYSSSYYSSYDGTYDSDNDYSYSTGDCIWGSFSSNVSSTFSYESEYEDSDDSYISSYSYDFYTYYPDGSYAQGRYFSDVITLGDVSLDNFTVGLVNTTDRYIGVLGLGYNDSSHSTFVDRLAAQGLINSTAFSIWVDDAQASSGNILFGAIDKTKFEGNLSRLSSSYSGEKMMVQISSINATTKDSTGPISITYDEYSDTSYYGSSSSSSYSGSSYGYDDYMFTATFSPPDPISVLPDDVTAQLWEIAGSYYDTRASLALIGCNAGGTASTTFSFRLGKGPNGPNISVALEDLIVPVTDVDLRTYSYLSSYVSSDTCVFGVQNSSYGYAYSQGYNLGSSLLRRTYSVFDFANDEIAIAPVKFDATETSDIVAFATYGARAPSSTMDCTSSYCSRTGTDDDGTIINPDGTVADGGEDDSYGLGAGILTVPALIGTALGVGLGSLLLGIAGFLLWRHRRNKKLAAGKDGDASVLSAEAGEPAATGAMPVPQMSQASQPQPPPGSAKGKAPEILMPENLASSSGHGHGPDVHGSESAPASSSHNA
ncbi:hypothetical protein KVR01_010563 [Diaporthe batatas]|uniref:uncharacterized protein n=1 Tax=Diaporthe batatas TaxID=748121 RepID=UPI001D05141A|nr:uncharacterized protein KVR01_010563 [Diaporthe batatas]KAG8159926.1 hypothetical protein KVR01_010563 [Diaporthe batatas]